MMFPHWSIKQSGYKRFWLLVSCLLLFAFGLSRNVASQDNVATVSLQRDVEPQEGMIGEDVFVVTLTLVGDSSECPVGAVVRPLDIMLVLDRSGSMNDPSGTGTATRMDLLKQATNTFLGQVNFSRDQVGVVQFDSGANIVHSLSNDRVSISNAINAMFSSGGTAIDAGVEIARREFADRGRPEAGHVMILFTDGITSSNARALERAQQTKNEGIRLITIGLGRDDVDESLLREMASQTSDFYFVEDASELQQVYVTIAQSVTTSPVAATDVIFEHRFDATAFQVVDGSIDPPNGVLSGNVISWPLRELLDTSVVFSYQTRPLAPGSYNIDQGDSIQYNRCGDTPATLDLPAALPVALQQPTPTPTPSPTITPTPPPTPTPTPTLIPPPPPTATPTWEDTASRYSASLRCDLSWLGYLLALLLLLFFIWWLRKLWQEYQKPEHERAPCRWIPWLFLPLTLILLWLIVSQLDLCRLESVYFWRIDPASSQGQIYVTDRDGIRPAAGFDAVNQNYSCVGCHAVTSTGQKIAAVTESGAGPIVVYNLNGERIDIPNVTGSYVDWSPDGSRLAISNANGDIVIMDIAGQRVTPLQGASEPGVAEMMPSWSADGQFIAFARGRSSPNSFTLTGEADIYVVPASGGAAVPVPGASGSGLNYYPAYSPDGKWLAFTRHETGTTSYADPKAEIFLVPANGGERIRLAANDDLINRVTLENVSNSWPTWSSDGEWLAFNSKRNDPAYDLFLTHINEDGQSDMLFPLAGAANPGVFEHLPFWGQPPVVDPWPAILALWPFLLLYLLIWLLYWLCKRLRPQKVVLTPLPDPVIAPEPLPPATLQPIWQVAPTLIIGVGGTGRWVLTHLKKTLLDSGFGELPPKTQFVLLDTSETEETRSFRDHRDDLTGVQFAGVSLKPDEMLLMGQNLAGVIGDANDAALAGWFAHDEFQQLPERAKNMANGTGGQRQLARAGLISKLRKGDVQQDNSHLVSNDAQRLWRFLVDGSRDVLDGQQIRIMLVGSTAGGMSGTLADLAYLARLAAETVLPSSEGTVRVEAYLTTDSAFKSVANNHIQQQINTISAAREIQRFQLSAGLPFRMDYRANRSEELPAEQLHLSQTYQKKLFDDILLFGGEGAPERGADKAGEPWATTLASMADIIAFHMDKAMQSKQGDYREAVRADMEARQREAGQAIVSTAGSFTYRLPLIDILYIVHTNWAHKLFHVFLNGKQTDRNPSFDPAKAGLTDAPAELARKFVMGEFEQSPAGMSAVGKLSTSARLLARDVIRLADGDSGAYIDYLRRVLDMILNGALEGRGPRLGYAHAFLRELDPAMTRALESAKANQVNASDGAEERPWWGKLLVYLGFGQATKAEWDRVVDTLTAWQAITNRSLTSLVGVRKLLVGSPEDDGTTVIPGLYRELEMRQAEAAQRPSQMDQIAVRRYLWSEPISPDKSPDDPNNQRKLAEKWYEQAAEQLAGHLKRLHWRVEADGSIRLALMAFKKERAVALDDRRVESVNDLADELLALAAHLTQEQAKKVSLADALPTQFASEDERDLLPVVQRNWQAALPHLRGGSESNLQDYKPAAAVGVPDEVAKNEQLALVPDLFTKLRDKIANEFAPVNATLIPINDRTMLTIVREYDQLPILTIPAMRDAQEAYIRNAGLEQDRLARPTTITPVFAAERLALAYERRLEENRLLNQPYRFLHPQVIIGLQEPELARLYLLALAARWLKTLNKQASLEMPGMSPQILDYPERATLPPLVGGWLRFTQNRAEDVEIRQWLRDALSNPSEETKQAWRRFIDSFQERIAPPAALVCVNTECKATIKPGAKFCTNCGADAPLLPAAPTGPWQEPYADQPQVVRDLAAIAALTAYRELVSAEEWDRIVMRQSRLA
jgi:uncharacterized protein YegL